MAYSDFPMPEDFPDYARHDQVRAYFEHYVDHFGFRHTITFDTTVEDVSRAIVALAQPGLYWMNGNTINVDGGEAIAG
jgi:NAD(P)-dependent dehydrogenase (short-subunit alcohol dehydrogenase family)